MKLRAIIVAAGGVYIAILATMFAHGWERPAAYLAIPGWYVVAVPFSALVSAVPGVMDLLGWQSWYALRLVLRGLLNLLGAYWFAKALERRHSDPQGT